jgi:hypothetical protein
LTILSTIVSFLSALTPIITLITSKSSTTTTAR